MCNDNEHKLIYMEKKTNKYHVFGIRSMFSIDYKWKREDIYHCEKCGEIVTKVKEAIQDNEPEWY